MLGPNCWTLLILSILPVSAAADVDAAYCKNGKISVKNVTDILSVVNERRTKLAKGLEEDKNGQRLPPAKNMRKMAYDCTLEHEAESALDVLGCDSTEFPPQAQKGLIFFWCISGFGFEYSPLSVDLYDLKCGMGISFSGNQPVRYIGNFDNALSYANLMRGSASKIGCAVRTCSNNVLYVNLCLTDERPVRYLCFAEARTGPTFCMPYPFLHNIDIETHRAMQAITNDWSIQKGDEIYEVGSAETCECDKPLGCDGVLCVQAPAEFPGSSPTEPSNKCPSKEISDTMRMHMQDTHNYRRSLLALGQVVNNQKKTLPAASNMNYLVWNCTLEREAHDFLRDCPTIGYLRPDDNSVAQNFYYGTTNEPTFRDMNKKAVTEWWKQVRKVEGPKVAKPVFLPKHNSSNIKSYTLMGWASSREMGCSIAKCGDYWVEACRYYPPGNEVNKQMYKPGKACSKCESGAKPCDSSLGLCGSKK